jgi:hypothetical protein
LGTKAYFAPGEVDELMNKVSALSVLSNAVLVWNTIRITEIIASFEATTGKPVPGARLLVSGRYNFDRATPPDPLYAVARAYRNFLQLGSRLPWFKSS